jgi:hypothetical protein
MVLPLYVFFTNSKLTKNMYFQDKIDLLLYETLACTSNLNRKVERRLKLNCRKCNPRQVVSFPSRPDVSEALRHF